MFTCRAGALIATSALAVVSVLAPSTLAAQLCIGLPDISVAPVSVTASANWADETQGYDVRLGLGRGRGFLGGSLGRLKTKGIAVISKTAAVDGGMTFKVNTGTTTLQVCEVGSIFHDDASKEYEGELVNASAYSFAGGLAVGGIASVRRSVELIPFASARLVHQHSTLSGFGEVEKFSDSGTELGFGTTLLFSRRYSLTPAVRLPIGLRERDAVFSIGASASFGRR